MSDPVLGHDELVSAQAQAEVTVNRATRKLSAALAGEITIDFSSDANYAMQADNTQPENDEWPYSVIRMTDTGVVLTGPVDVEYPDVDTEYGGPSRMVHIFINDTAETLTSKRSGQTGIAVPAGTARRVRHDGADIVDADSAATGPPTSPVVTLAGDTYTLGDLTDGAWHEFTSATAVTITVLNDASEAVDGNAEFGIMATGTGGVTLAIDDAAIIVPPKGGTLVLEQNDFSMLKRRAADIYKLLGETAAA
jgi:hypothetical protein